MNGRSGIVTFFLFLFLAVLILLQILSMVQSDRLYERFNQFEQRMGNVTVAGSSRVPSKAGSVERYPGDDGDWLVWRLGAEPATLNPLVCRDLAGTWILDNILESMLEYDPDTLELKPKLAESYEVSEDGLEMTFKLRDDIYFSDGKPITADDVVFTFETIKNPKVDAASLANYFDDVESLEKVSEREVHCVMRQKYFKSLSIIGGMGILPKHIYQFEDAEDFNQRRSNPVGSGPYVFEKWDVGREVVLRRNDDYWREKPNLKKIVFRMILNDTAATQAMQTGEIDLMRPLPEQYAELSEDPVFSKQFKCLSYWNPGSGYFYIGWNQDTPFFKDKRVRLAMTYMVDRESVIKYLLKGTGMIPTGPFYVYGRQNDPSIKPWPYDLDKSRKLLEEAGWVDTDGDGIRDKDGVAFRFKYMIVSGASLHEQMVKLVKDSAAQIGIEVEADPYEWSVFTDKLRDRQFQAVNLAWGGSIETDPYQIWHSSQAKDHGSNYVGFENSEADALIEEARRTLDEEDRNKLYHRFHQILHEEQPYTFIYSRPSQRFLDRRFENVIIHKLGLDYHEWYVPLEQQKYQ